MDIISKIIVDLLLTTPTRIRGGDEADLKVNSTAGGSPPALKMFVHSVEDDVYTAKVNSVLKLNLVAKFVAIDVSFCQASKLYHSVKEETGMGSSGSVTDHKVGHLCQIGCAVNLQYLKELFKKIWAFSIGLDAGNNAGSSYLDIRMRCFFKGDLQNLHLMAIPMQERHTGVSISVLGLQQMMHQP